MVFDQGKLDRATRQARGIFNTYVYETKDLISTVIKPGYFSASQFAISDGPDTNGDGWHNGLVECQCLDGLVIGRIDSATGTIIPEIESDFKSLRPVRVKEDLAGELDSSVVYLLDGIIDMQDQQITVPAEGLSIRGTSFRTSGLISSADNYTMFVSEAGGSGDLVGEDYLVTVNGTGSKVYDLLDVDGTHAFEFEAINYLGCTSLGKINGYRQGLETGTGRIGGTPDLELDGTWSGYRITTSIIVALDSGFTGSIFKAGPSFEMGIRFITDVNCDLPAGGSFADFAPSNFTAPSVFQIRGADFTRNGLVVSDDPNLTPNITASDLECAWSDNRGINNTFEGGRLSISTEAATVVSVIGDFYDIAGTTTASNLAHFDQPANGQLRQLGDSPRDYLFFSYLQLQGSQNDQLMVKVVKWDDSVSSFVDLITQTATVNNFSGPRDVAIVNINYPVTLDRNDYVKLQVANASTATNITAEIDSFLFLSER